MPGNTLGPWFFGKMPSAGDFVWRGIDADTRDSLDRWLSDEMQGARAAFPEQFERRYAQAPAWCFVNDNAGPGWSGGMLCASMDRVGRHFPFIIGASAVDVAAAVAVAGACCEVVNRAFAEGWEPDRLRAAPLHPAPLPWSPTRSSWALLGEEGPALEVDGDIAGERPTGLLAKMMELAE